MNYQDLVIALRENSVTAAEVDQYLAKAKVDAGDVEPRMVGAIAASIIKDRAGAMVNEPNSNPSTMTTAGRKPGKVAKRQERQTAEAAAVKDGMTDVKLNAAALSNQVAETAQEGVSNAVALAIAAADREINAGINAYVARRNQNAAKFEAFIDGLDNVLHSGVQKTYKQLDIAAQLEATPSPFDSIGDDFFAPL